MSLRVEPVTTGKHRRLFYKLPERLEYLDALPRNPVGKVVKPDLRARWSVPEDPVTSATTNPEGDLS